MATSTRLLRPTVSRRKAGRPFINDSFAELGSKKRVAPNGTDIADSKRHRANDDQRQQAAHGCRPAEGSIHGLMRQYRRKRLYVSPVSWTGLHLQLLGVAFAQQLMNTGNHDANRVTSNNDKAQQGDLKQAGYIIKKKIQTEHVGVQADGITELLESYGILSLRLNEVSLHLGGRRTCTMATDTVFKTMDGIPRILYINFATIQSRRKKYIESRTPIRPRVSNAPAMQIRGKKLRLIQPAFGRETEDPYIAGLLIGLAQLQQAALQANRSTVNRAVGATVYAIGVPGIEPLELQFYKAYIPSAFLARWEKPAELSSCATVDILHTSISLTEPSKAARLLSELFQNNGLCP